MTNKAAQFETEVSDLLQELGWETKTNVLLSAYQVDIYAEQRIGVVPIRLVVECKDYGKPVGNADIQEFASRAAILKNHGIIDKALFVSRHGFTASAIRAAETYGITCTSYEELVSNFVDFSLYLKEFVKSYQASTIYDRFVEPLLRTAEGETHPALKFLEDWLDSPSTSYLSLLGDAGSGKTALCQKLAFKLADKVLNGNRQSRVPIFISLRDYQHVRNLRELVTDLLVEEHGVHLRSYASFERLLREGRILLIFDGLDEMSPRFLRASAWSNFWEIAELAKPASKVLLTCRTNYFRDEIEESLFLKGSKNYLSNLISKRPHFEVAYLVQWTEKEIREYLEKALPDQWQHVAEMIQGTYNLRDLASSPTLLEMIVRTAPIIGKIPANRATMYKAYIDTALDQETMARHKWFQPDRMRVFLQHLAAVILSRGTYHIPYANLQLEAETFFKEADKDEANVLLSSVLTLPFLSRDADGNYMFSHKSIMEYLVAEGLILQDAPQQVAAEYPPGIQEFVKDLLNA